MCRNVPTARYDNGINLLIAKDFGVSPAHDSACNDVPPASGHVFAALNIAGSRRWRCRSL